MENALTVLQRIERLTAEQRDLIGQDEQSALEENLNEKDRLIEALKGMPADTADTREVLDRIVAMERGNIELARSEMARLQGLMKRTQEGMVAVRGYDGISSNVGATYIDKKN